jgi:hypothetical protein
MIVTQTTLFIKEGNEIPTWQFKYACYTWGQNAIPTLWL